MNNLPRLQNHHRFSKKGQEGFTIIELMIATMVFSAVIVVLTAGVLYFTQMYYKGVTLSTTQNTARQIADNISEAIQFSGKNNLSLPSDPDGATQDLVMCIGSKRYTYLLKKQVASSPKPGQVYHALVMDSQSDTCSDSPIADFNKKQVGGEVNTSSIIELVGDRMRLTKLAVQNEGSNNLYKITVGVAYGDDDLFTDNKFTACKIDAGSQFCAATTLVTTVQKRVKVGS